MKQEETVLYIPKSFNNKYNHNHDYFNDINTEAKAYILGYLLADGSLEIVKRGNCITSRLCFLNSIDDLEIIELINKEIAPDMKLSYRQVIQGAENRKQSITLRIVSSEICNTLIQKYNILPKKTYYNEFKFDFNNIPEEFQKDFIRGFFDGDGSVSFYKTNNTIFFNFSFIFNSPLFAKQIGEIFENKFNIKSVHREIKGKTCNWWTLRFDYSRDRTNKVKEIYNWLYKDSNYFLSRKKDKFIQYFEYRANSTVNNVE